MLTTVASSSTRWENAKSESSAPPIDTRAPTIGMPAAMKPAEDEEHDDEGQGQRDALAADEVALDGGRDRRDDLARAADGALRIHRRRHLEQRLLGGCLGLVLGRLVEARLEVDDGDEASRRGRAALSSGAAAGSVRPPGASSGERTAATPGTSATFCVAAVPSATTCGVGEVGAGHLHRQRLERGLGLLDDLAGLRRLRVDGRGAGVEPVEERLAGDPSDGDREAADRDEDPGDAPSARGGGR